MPALCTTQRNIPFMMSWRNVVCAARDEHHIPWSTSEERRGAPQSHCTAGALEGSMLMPRRWRRPVRTSPRLSSRVLVRGSVSSQDEAGRQAQLSKLDRALFRLVCRHQRSQAGLLRGTVRPAGRTHATPLQWCPGCQDSPHGTLAATDLRLRCAEMPTGAEAPLRLARQTAGRPRARGAWSGG
jgi:hypothetical protein